MFNKSLVLSAAMIFASPLALSLGAEAAGGTVGTGLTHVTESGGILISASSSDEIQKGAENFITNMTKRGISFLSDSSLSQAERKKEFERLLNDSFDIKTIARFSLGRYWRVANKQERKEYMSLFNKMIIDVYSSRFGDYQGQELVVSGSRAEGTKDAIVSSKITGDGSPEVKVDWRVRYKDGQYKVIDVLVEGVSMSLTQRSDFASVIQRGGGKVDVLLAHMRK